MSGFSIWMLPGVAVTLVAVQILSICVACEPRRWRRYFQKLLLSERGRTVSYGKLLDERLVRFARRTALTLLLVEIALAFCFVAWCARLKYAVSVGGRAEMVAGIFPKSEGTVDGYGGKCE
jgi:hypothetical protein